MAPATAPMILPACVRATFKTSSSAREELTADAMARRRPARSRAPLSSARAASSCLVVLRRRHNDTVSRTKATTSRIEVTSRTLAISGTEPPFLSCPRLTPLTAGLFGLYSARPGADLFRRPSPRRRVDDPAAHHLRI